MLCLKHWQTNVCWTIVHYLFFSLARDLKCISTVAAPGRQDSQVNSTSLRWQAISAVEEPGHSEVRNPQTRSSDALFSIKNIAITIINDRFTVLRGTQTQSSDENSVCLSVRLSICQTRDCERRKNLSRFLYHMKNHLA